MSFTIAYLLFQSSATIYPSVPLYEGSTPSFFNAALRSAHFDSTACRICLQLSLETWYDWSQRQPSIPTLSIQYVATSFRKFMLAASSIGPFLVESLPYWLYPGLSTSLLPEGEIVLTFIEQCPKTPSRSTYMCIA